MNLNFKQGLTSVVLVGTLIVATGALLVVTAPAAIAQSATGTITGQVTDQLAAWPPGPQTGADQPPTSAYLSAGALAFALSTLRYALAMPRSFSLVEGGSQLRPSVR